MSFKITSRIAMELLAHEGIVREAYKDSVGVWTWSVGITNRSGITIHPKYKDNPAPMRECLEAYVTILEKRFAPAVRQAFAGRALTEAQFGAALSFHYNTGAIGRAQWVKSWMNGKRDAARAEIMNWRKPPEIIPRREKERDLFFDGKWSGTPTVLEYPVEKPSYQPAFRRAQRVDIEADLRALLV